LHVTDTVAIFLGRVHDQQPTTRHRQHGLHQLGPEPCQAAPVLNHDRRNLQVTQQPKQFRAVPVQPRPDLGDCSIHAEVVSSGPCGYSCYLPFKVLALLSTRHTSVYEAHPSTHGDPGWSMRISPPTQVATTGSFHSRNHRYAVTASTPFTKAHSLKSTITY